jgi:dimethyladenosine transferase 1
VIQGNMLTIDHQQIITQAALPLPTKEPMHIMGNLPFNVASPLLLQWLHLQAKQEGVFSLGDIWMTLMFQKEVGDVRFTLI